MDIRNNPTFSEYASHWIEYHKNEVRPQSMSLYENHLRKHILPIIGDVPIKDLHPDQIRSVLNAAAEKSHNTVLKIRSIIKLILDAAIEDDIIPYNPTPKVKQIGKQQKEKHALTEAQVESLKSAVSGEKCEPFVLIGLYTGMRQGEILALKWECVHLDVKDPYIEVKRTLNTINGKSIISDVTKTAAGKRNIPIPTALQDYLSNMKRQGEYVISYKGSFLPINKFSAYTYCIHQQEEKNEIRTYTRKDGSISVYNYTRKLGDYIPALKKYVTLDFHFHPHLLRRTYITMLIANGMDPKTVQYLAGHASSRITMDIYAQVMYNTPAQLSGEINRIFKDNLRDNLR